jgi:long-chain acyl-CoA synthetase
LCAAGPVTWVRAVHAEKARGEIMAEGFDNLVELLERSCAAFAEHDLFGEKRDGAWRFISFRDFKRLVDDFRGGLASLGVRAGDRVGIIANNRVEWAVAAYATYGLGAAFVPMYEAQRPEEWKFILADCGAKLAIAASAPIFDALLAMQRELNTLEHVVGLHLPESNAQSYEAVLGRGQREPTAPAAVTSTDVAGLIYTSGTTGEPKGVVLTHGNFASNVSAIHELFPIGTTDRTLAFLPWAHSFGQTGELHMALSMGCAIAINDDIPNLVANLAEVKPTILIAVPRIFNRIYDGVNKQMADKPSVIQNLFRSGVRIATERSRGARGGALDGITLALADKLIFSKIRGKFGGRLKYCISGSAALSKDVAEFINALGIQVYEGYGLSETSPVVTVNYPGHRKFGSVGKAIPQVRVSIDTRATGDEKNGEIIVYGPNVMRGYHHRPEDNAEVLLADGGFRTGDMGYVDAEGYLFITGRIKEQYKLENGKYVVPAPLEEELKLSPHILNVMIYGANKPHNVALIVIDTDSVNKWARDEGFELTDPCNDERVARLIRGELDKCSKSFKSYEKIKRFMLITEDFTIENDMLTPKMSLKRRHVVAKYEPALLGLY